MLNGLLVFLLLLIGLLAIPITLIFQISWQQAVQNNVKLLWAFGLVQIRLPLFRTKAPSPGDDGLARRAGRFEQSSRNKREVFAVIRQKKFRRRIIRFTSDVWQAIHKENIRLRVRVGLGDPADTGQLWAVLGPVSGMLANFQEVSMNIEPDFFDTTLELDSSGSIRIIPLQMIYLITALLLSPPVWQGIKRMRGQ